MTTLSTVELIVYALLTLFGGAAGVPPILSLLSRLFAPGVPLPAVPAQPAPVVPDQHKHPLLDKLTPLFNLMLHAQQPVAGGANTAGAGLTSLLQQLLAAVPLPTAVPGAAPIPASPPVSAKP